MCDGVPGDSRDPRQEKSAVLQGATGGHMSTCHSHTLSEDTLAPPSGLWKEEQWAPPKPKVL